MLRMQSPLSNEIYAFSWKFCPRAETKTQAVTIQVVHHANHVVWHPLMVLQ